MSPIPIGNKPERGLRFLSSFVHGSPVNDMSPH